MAGELIITNGDGAGRVLKAAGIGTEILPWRDVLHDGPVRQMDELADLSRERATFLGANGFGLLTKLQDSFIQRDELLARNEDFAEVTLWFEHDLYDQLQLLQILDWFAANWRDDGRVYLVQANDYLGAQTASSIKRFSQLGVPVTGLQLCLARIAWAAFRHETPEPWAALRTEDLSALPYLKPCVIRMLEELPSTFNGLCRVEHMMLGLINDSDREARELFGSYCELEEAKFLGDSSFFKLMDGLSNAATPLICGHVGALWEPTRWTVAAQKHYMRTKLRLTATGRDVLAGRADHAALNGVDRWWGGTHLTNDTLWRWDGDDRRLVGSPV